MEHFTQISQEIFAKVYQQSGAQGAGAEQAGGSNVNEDGTVESSFEENN